MLPADDPLARGLAKAGVASAQRHLFFCLGPDCCASIEGEALWEFAKKEIRDLRLPVMRTKAGCLRVCAGGPLLVVYPDGIWYAGVTPNRLARILREHIRDGNPVHEWVVATNNLHPTA